MCEVCSEGIREGRECKLVYFKKGKRGKEWDKKASEPGFVGHPPYAGWFCMEHLERAQELSHLTLPEAMDILTDEFS
jgi:hypothetical protein